MKRLLCTALAFVLLLGALPCAAQAGHTHTWDAGPVTTPPDCKNEGVRTYTCTGCGATKTALVPTAPHAWIDWQQYWVTTPETSGAYVRVCQLCQLWEYCHFAPNGVPGDIETPISGTCGLDATWTLYQGTLVVLGTGPMDFAGSAPPWQEYMDKIRFVNITHGITTVDSYAFANATNLTELYLPSTLDKLCDFAFYRCTSLYRITSGANLNLSELGKSCFEGCSSLDVFLLSNSVTKLGERCFAECTALEALSISHRMTGLPKEVCTGCTSLDYLIIPASITKLGHGCFSGSGLDTVIFQGDAPTFEGSDHFLNVTATAKYGFQGTTWSSEVLKHYGGYLEWRKLVPGGESFASLGEVEPNNSKDKASWIYNATIRGYVPEDEGYDSVDYLKIVMSKSGSLSFSVCSPSSTLKVRVETESGYVGETSAGTYKGGDNNNGRYTYTFSQRVSAGTYYLRMTDTAGADLRWEMVLKAAGVNNYTAANKVSIPSYDITVIPPTCTAMGYSYYNKAFRTDYTPKAPHHWDAGVVTTQPTQETAGVRTYTCGFCKQTKSETVPPLGHTHSFGPWAIETESVLNGAAGTKHRSCECGKTETATYTNPLVDVPNGKYFSKPIFWAYENGITKGKTATEFQRDAECTRKQIVMFLWRAAGEPEPKSMENPFVDVKADSFQKAILWAYYEGITSGKTATEFQPEAPCTREQIVMFLWRYFDKPAPQSMVNPFTDVKVGGTFEKAILWAYYEGITTGKTATTFEPQATCTRGQIVTFLYRAMVKE